MLRRSLRSPVLAVGATLFLACGMCSPASADEVVRACGSYPNNVFQAASDSSAYVLGADCSGNNVGSLYILAGSENLSAGQSAHWQANAPAGLTIVGGSVASPSLSSYHLNNGNQFGGGFYWQGGGVQITDNQASVGFGPISSPYAGFQIVCGAATCNDQANLYVVGMALYVQETVGPSFAAPTGLWQASGWVRGSWPFFVWGNSPSGLCSISATMNGALINTTTSAQDLSAWHQCAAPPIDQPVDTSKYGQGAIPLTLSAGDAAGVPASSTKTVYVDNQQPTVTLSGLTDAPSTAGTQYVTATAAAGPSGIDGISCSVDGAPAQWYASGTAQVPVSGVGEHQVQCYAENNAVDANGVRGTSARGSFSIKIGVPTVTGIAFSKIVDQLRCHRALDRVKLAARWVTVRRHHERVRVRSPAHVKLVKVTKCHARTVRRRRTVSVTVRRHGRRVRVRRSELVRVIVLPHVAAETRLAVGHGRATTVSGWLGTYTGIALGGQTVEILAAPDNGQGAFKPVGLATTAADGSWSAELPAGPSRLVEAGYGGGTDVEPSLSGALQELVPAEVKLLSVSPRKVAWGATVRLVGQLKGGYLPSGGALVRLRIGLGSTFTTYGVHEHVTGNGRFATSYTFGVGEPSVHRSFWFQVASLPMGDYPYAPANSRRIAVLLGGHPAHIRRRTGRKR